MSPCWRNLLLRRGSDADGGELEGGVALNGPRGGAPPSLDHRDDDDREDKHHHHRHKNRVDDEARPGVVKCKLDASVS